MCHGVLVFGGSPLVGCYLHNSADATLADGVHKSEREQRSPVQDGPCAVVADRHGRFGEDPRANKL